MRCIAHESVMFPPPCRDCALLTYRAKSDACAVQIADARALAELRDRLDAIDDATTERVLNHLLAEAPDMHRRLLREASLIDPDVVADALRHEGAMP